VLALVFSLDIDERSFILCQRTLSCQGFFQAAMTSGIPARQQSFQSAVREVTMDEPGFSVFFIRERIPVKKH
jgi:hypothetical protein